MEDNFSIEKLRQKQVSGNCFPYLDKEYYEVNEALGEILREFERLNPLLKNQLIKEAIGLYPNFFDKAIALGLPFQK